MSLDPQSRTAGAEAAEKNTASAEKVRTVFVCLAKLVLAKKIYASTNPTLLRFSEDFFQALRQVFDEEDVLVVSIDKHQIRWNDEVVYESDKRDESIAFILYRDGIGELSIHKDVTPKELDQFVDLIKNAVRAIGNEDDIVTQLWRADLEHISYRVLDEYLVGEFGEGRRDGRQSNLVSLETEDHPDAPSFAEKGRIVVSDQEEVEPLDSYLKRLVGGAAAEMNPTEREAHFQDMMAAFFTVSGEELRVAKDKLFEGRKKDSLVSFIDEYLEFAMMKDNPSALRDVANIIERVTDYLVSELRAPVLSVLLRDIREFAAMHLSSDTVRELAATIEGKLTNSSLLLSLGETAGSSEEELDAVLEYFEVVGEKSIPTVCKFLEANPDQRLHRAARDALIRVAGDKLPEVVTGFNIDKPHVARDVIALAKAARFSEVPQVIKELVYYPDDHVRREAIHFLAGFGTDEALQRLVKLLDDADKRIRLMTLAIVSAVDAPVVKARVIELAFGREFAQREFDEQVEIFKALGRVAGEDAVPRLKRAVGKKTILGIGKRHNVENKLLAIEALEQIDRPAAKELLGDLAHDSDGAVRSRAEVALHGDGRNRSGGAGAAGEAQKRETR
jgi:HEAT repeat protein